MCVNSEGSPEPLLIAYVISTIISWSVSNEHLTNQTSWQYIHVQNHFNCNCIWAALWQNQQNDCVPSEDSDQSGHPPSLSRIFAVRMKKAWVLSYPLSAQRRLRSDWVDAQADLSRHWAQSFCWFCHEAAHLMIVMLFLRDFCVTEGSWKNLPRQIQS